MLSSVHDESDSEDIDEPDVPTETTDGVKLQCKST